MEIAQSIDFFLAILAKCLVTIYLTSSIWWRRARRWTVVGVEDRIQSCSWGGAGQKKHLCPRSILWIVIKSSRCFRLAQFCRKTFLTLCDRVRSLGLLSHTAACISFPPDQFLGGSDCCPVTQKQIVYLLGALLMFERKKNNQKLSTLSNFMTRVWIVLLRAI